MADKNVQLPDGRVVAFPDSMADADIAEVIKKQLAPPPDIKTGQGMEQQAVEQSRQQIGAPVIQAANEHEARQARLAYLQNRAMNSPTPFSNAAAVLAPVTAARQIVGAKVGSYAGEQIAPMLSNSPDAAEYGSLIGGVLGGVAGSYQPGGATKAVQRITRGPGGTAKVSLNPLEIAGRELEGVVPKQADIQEQMTAAETARQQWLTDRAKLEMQDATEQAAAVKRQQAADRLAASKQRFADAQAAKNAPEPSPMPASATSTAAEAMFQKNFGPEYKQAADLAEWETGSREGSQGAQTAAGWKTPSTSGLPQGSSTPFPQVRKLSDLAGAPDDLISRTKTIVRPGEAPSAADLKRAGDLTQVPLTKLRQLASWGDELAKNEIVRRLRNQ